MPISDRIVKEINKLEITDAEKELMMKVLKKEDAGLAHYKSEYEKMVNNYIAEQCGE